MSRQYCRYCGFCRSYEDRAYCNVYNKEMAKNTAKSVNQCPYFAYINLDALGETKGYRPRSRISHKFDGQMSLFGGDG